MARIKCELCGKMHNQGSRTARRHKANKLPDTSEAEEWITTDIFRYKDKLYQIDLWGTITEYSDVWGTITEYADWECPKCHKKGGMKYPSNVYGQAHCKYCGKYSWMIDPDKRKDR